MRLCGMRARGRGGGRAGGLSVTSHATRRTHTYVTRMYGVLWEGFVQPPTCPRVKNSGSRRSGPPVESLGPEFYSRSVKQVGFCGARRTTGPVHFFLAPPPRRASHTQRATARVTTKIRSRSRASVTSKLVLQFSSTCRSWLSPLPSKAGPSSPCCLSAQHGRC